jgi:hypothetical protein
MVNMIRRIIKNKQPLFFLFTSTVLLLASCKKDPVPGTINEMLIVNASPNAGGLELLQNLHSVGTFNYLSGEIITSPAYVQLDSGFNNYKIRQAGVERANFLLSNTSNKTSLWLYDSVSTLKYLLLKDVLDTPGRAFAKVRYLFLSPGMDTLNIRRNNADTIYANAAYYTSQQKVEESDLAAFRTIDTGNVLITMEPINTSTSIRTKQFRFESNGVYSFVVKGYQQRAGADSLSLSIIKHN